MNPLQYIGQLLGTWLYNIYTAIMDMWYWMQDVWATITDTDFYMEWAASVFPEQSPDVALMFDQARSVVMLIDPVLRLLALAIDLRAVAIFLTAFIALETALLVIYLWRGFLSILPFAG